ncbi:MAG TPA: ABC transporter permease [Bryobacteraceae bacterium]|nr:ABC transporter permease [Bryobacteraceae bacterium]
MRAILCRLAAIFRQRSLDRQLEEELRFHLDMEADANRRRGMSAPDARLAARRCFGAPANIAEIYREQRGLPVLETLFKDLFYGLRTLRRNRGFAAIAVLSLALGIGANTAIFSIIEAVMLRPLPVPAPASLVSVGDPGRPDHLLSGTPLLDIFSYPLYVRLRDHNTVFTGLLASGGVAPLEVNDALGASEPVRGRLVSGNYFDVLGVHAALGRTFTSDDESRPGAAPFVVISDEYWARHFARAGDALGRVIRLNGFAFTIVGVGPRGFAGEVTGSPADLWIPLSMQAQVNHADSLLNDNKANWLLFLGRLKDGVSVAAARSQVTSLAVNAVIELGGSEFSANDIAMLRRRTVEVAPCPRGFSSLRKRFSQPLLTLMIVVGLVLLIACANVTNLLLARAAGRQKEISIRLAMGSGRRRLVRQLLTESLMLAALGGTLGLILAGWGNALLLRMASTGKTPIPLDVHLDAAMLGFTATVTIFTGILFGLAPALRSTQVDLASTLKENTRSLGSRGWQLGKLLVAAQVALSLLLLVGAGLFIRTLINLRTLNVGYSRTGLAIMRVDAGASGYTKTQILPLARRIEEHLSSLPGVSGVSISSNGIFNGTDGMVDGLRVEGFTPVSHEDTACHFDAVGPHYFQVVGVPVLAGREFDERDGPGSQLTVIINQSMARFYFGSSDPLGKAIQEDDRRYTIVGVVGDMRENELKGSVERRLYWPVMRSTAVDGLNFEIGTHPDASAMIEVIRRELQRLEPTLKITNLKPVGDLIDASYSEERLIAKLCGFFGALALVLAATGIYGVMSYAMSRRTNEIGLRLALGANRKDVLHMVLRETMHLTISGIAIGLPAALAASRLIGASLVGLTTNDPPSFVIAVLVVLLAAMLAGFVPAARAARIDPMSALRQE